MMGKHTVNRRNAAFTLLYAVSGLVTAFLLSWIILAQQNFFYGFWHDQVGIGEGIDRYGPLNRYKEGFGETSREERIRLFAAINEAVHNDGEGLADIEYHSEALDQPRQLLRPPEIGHLEDVAELISLLQWTGITFALVWLGCCAWAIARKRPLPALKHQMLGIGVVILLVGLVVLVVGPVAVFNQLHIWIFPADHPWFFYYQDSLMSTLMLAPRLFGWITVVWVPLAILCFLLLHVLAIAIQRRLRVPRQAHNPQTQKKGR